VGWLGWLPLWLRLLQAAAHWGSATRCPSSCAGCRVHRTHLTHLTHTHTPLPHPCRQADHLADLEAEGIHIWHFEQHELEAVYIPGGCPHDVRNLRPCIKVRGALRGAGVGRCVGAAWALCGRRALGWVLLRKGR
jgi:hypothetical protein